MPVRTEATGQHRFTIEHAALDPRLLGRAVDAVQAARRGVLASRPVGEIIQIIARLAAEWQRPGSPWRELALAALPATTGLSPAMIAEALPQLFEPLSAERLWAFVEAETGDARALDGFVPTPWGERHAIGPALVAHVAAGNVPGLGLPVLVTALLAKAAVVMKPAAGEPVLAAMVARSLASLDAGLGSCVAVAYWPGGRLDLDDALLSRADVVLVEGSDEAVAAVRARASGRVLGFGRRVSLAVVAREATADVDAVAAAIARDVSLYDQHGCLSPQVVYVETGGPVEPAGIASALGQALVRLAGDLPRRLLTPAERAAIRNLRAESEWQAVAGSPVRIFGASADDGPTVVYEATSRFEPTCANRTVRVKPLTRLEDLPEQLGSWAGLVEALGAAGPAPRIRRLALAMAAHSTASRICPLGHMQAPSLGWHHGGMPRLGSLLRWLDIEWTPDNPPAPPSGAAGKATRGGGSHEA